MARLGGTSFVISAGQGTWQLETRRGAVMNGAPAEHVREGVPVLAHYCDALGIRAFACGADLEADLAETSFKEMVGLVNKPVINMESAANHPCQALADWKTLDDLAVPRRAQVRSVLGESSARVAAGGARRHGAHGRDARHGSGGAAAGRFRAAAGRDEQGRGRPPPPRAARCARPADRDDALSGAHVVYAKEWGSTAHYGNAEADAQPRAALADWCVRDTWFSRAAVDCKLMHCLPVRRNVAVADEVLDGRRSVVQREAYNRMVVQTAVLHRLLATPQH